MARRKKPKQFDSFDLEQGPDDAWDLMQGRIKEIRRDKIQAVAAKRTNHVRLALQDVHDPHNIGACLRSAEGLGIQNVDFINFYQKFTRPSKVSRGAFQWMDLLRFKDAALYRQGLRERGYRIAAAYPSGTDYTLDELPIDQPLVVLFGNEKQGLHESWTDHVDYRFSIPMNGFVESFNISVSVAVSLYSLTQRCQRLLTPDRYFVNETEQRVLLNRWMLRQSRSLDKELERLRANQGAGPKEG